MDESLDDFVRDVLDLPARAYERNSETSDSEEFSEKKGCSCSQK